MMLGWLGGRLAWHLDVFLQRFGFFQIKLFAHFTAKSQTSFQRIAAKAVLNFNL